MGVNEGQWVLRWVALRPVLLHIFSPLCVCLLCKRAPSLVCWCDEVALAKGCNNATVRKSLLPKGELQLNGVSVRVDAWLR